MDKTSLKQDWRHFADFMRLVARRFKQDRCTQIAASLTFTTLLSLVPLLAIALSLLSAFPVFEDYADDMRKFIVANLMPEMATRVITQYMTQFAESAMRLTAVGIGTLAITAMLLLLSVEQAFNTIWQVTHSRPLFKRLIVYWAAMTLAPLLVGASLALTSWIVGLSMGYARHVPVFGVGVLKLLPVLLTWMAFALLFYFVPNRFVPRTHALIGAFVAALAFEAMNRVFGYYISHFASYKLVYGAFASVPIFLMWIYLSWLAILSGAVIAASLPHWRTPVDAQDSTAARLYDALRVMRAMTEGLREGRVAELQTLSRTLYISYDALDDIVAKLESADLIREAETGGWLLLRDARNIRVGELLKLFVLDAGDLPDGHDGDALRQWLADYAVAMERDADASLEELFARGIA